MTTITAAVLDERDAPFRVDEIEDPRPGEVLVRVVATGICTRTAWRSTATFGSLIELNRQGRFPFERLVATFPLEEINEALAASYAGDVLKPVVRMP